MMCSKNKLKAMFAHRTMLITVPSDYLQFFTNRCVVSRTNKQHVFDADYFIYAPNKNVQLGQRLITHTCTLTANPLVSDDLGFKNNRYC